MVLLGGGGEAVVGVGQDSAGLVEPVEQPVAVPAGPPEQPLLPGQLPRPFGEALGAEQLAADRSREQLVEPGTGLVARGGEQDAGDGALGAAGMRTAAR